MPPPRRTLALMASKLFNDSLGHLAEVDACLIQPAHKVADGGQVHSQGLVGRVTQGFQVLLELL